MDSIGMRPNGLLSRLAVRLSPLSKRRGHQRALDLEDCGRAREHRDYQKKDQDKAPSQHP